MVLLDAVARRLPGRARRGLRRARELLRRARRRARVPALHAAAGVPRLDGARRAPLRRPRPDRRLAPGARPVRDPLGRLFPNLPRDGPRRPRLGADDRRRDPDRPRPQGLDRQPVPDPVLVDGADAPLRAARRRAARRASATASSRAASASASRARTGARSSSSTPRRSRWSSAAAGGTFVKRLIGLPGETVNEDKQGYIWIEPPGRSFYELNEPYIQPSRRLADTHPFRKELAGAAGRLLLHGRQPRPVVRLAGVGVGPAEEPDRRRCSSSTGRRTGSASGSPVSKLEQVAPGLRRWAAWHAEWRQEVGAVAVDTPDGLVLIDPIHPPPEVRSPEHVLVTVHSHARTAGELGATHVWAPARGVRRLKNRGVDRHRRVREGSRAPGRDQGVRHRPRGRGRLLAPAAEGDRRRGRPPRRRREAARDLGAAPALPRELARRRHDEAARQVAPAAARPADRADPRLARRSRPPGRQGRPEGAHRARQA